MRLLSYAGLWALISVPLALVVGRGLRGVTRQRGVADEAESFLRGRRRRAGWWRRSGALVGAAAVVDDHEHDENDDGDADPAAVVHDDHPAPALGARRPRRSARLWNHHEHHRVDRATLRAGRWRGLRSPGDDDEAGP